LNDKNFNIEDESISDNLKIRILKRKINAMLGIIILLLVIISIIGYSSIDSVNKDLEKIKTNQEVLFDNEDKIMANQDILFDNKDILFENFNIVNDKVNDLKNKEINEKIAFLPITSDGYITTQTEFGKLAFYIEEVEEYLDGIKIELGIGNPNYVELKGLDLKIYSYKKNEGINTSVVNDKEYELIKLSDTFYPNKWKTVEIKISDFDPKIKNVIGIKPIIGQVRLKN